MVFLPRGAIISLQFGPLITGDIMTVPGHFLRDLMEAERKRKMADEIIKNQEEVETEVLDDEDDDTDDEYEDDSDDDTESDDAVSD